MDAIRNLLDAMLAHFPKDWQHAITPDEVRTASSEHTRLTEENQRLTADNIRLRTPIGDGSPDDTATYIENIEAENQRYREALELALTKISPLNDGPEANAVRAALAKRGEEQG